MTENIIKRYLLEQVYEQNKMTVFGKLSELQIQNRLFDLFKKGEIKIDENHFTTWLHQLNSSKKLFGTYLLGNNIIENKQKIIEITESESSSSINNIFLDGTKNYVIETVGSGCYSKPSSETMDGHLLINGIYNNQMIYLARVTKDGDFTVGYCGAKNSEYTKMIINYYKNLKRVLNLMIKTSKVEVIEETTLDSDKIYILNYNKHHKNNMLTFKSLMN